MIIQGKVLGVKRLPSESGKNYFTLIIEGARPIKVRDMQVIWKTDAKQKGMTASAEGKLKGSDNLKVRKVLITGPENEIEKLMLSIGYTTIQQN